MLRIEQRNAWLHAQEVLLVIQIQIIVLQFVQMDGGVMLMFVDNLAKHQVHQLQILHKLVFLHVLNLHIIKMVNADLNVLMVMLMIYLEHVQYLVP